ncbi:MAG: hypothetical protein MUC99_05940 [Anaerolineae bacterium]|nr:hypothetical protein [Anaerolineae bacterium]
MVVWAEGTTTTCPYGSSSASNGSSGAALVSNPTRNPKAAAVRMAYDTVPPTRRPSGVRSAVMWPIST